MVSQTLLRTVSSRLIRSQSPSLRAAASAFPSTSTFTPTLSSSSSSSSKTLPPSNRRFKSTAVQNDIPHESETFLSGTTSLYAEQMYENYLQDPNSVHETWRKYFDDMDSGREYDEQAFNRPTVVTSSRKPAAADANDSHLAVSFGFVF